MCKRARVVGCNGCIIEVQGVLDEYWNGFIGGFYLSYFKHIWSLVLDNMAGGTCALELVGWLSEEVAVLFALCYVLEEQHICLG